MNFFSLHGGQFRPDLDGQFLPVLYGQFKSVSHGLFHRILQLVKSTRRIAFFATN